VGRTRKFFINKKVFIIIVVLAAVVGVSVLAGILSRIIWPRFRPAEDLMWL